MTNESLKLDMTKPENRYALIVENIGMIERVLTERNHNYLMRVIGEAYGLWRSQIKVPKLEDVFPALYLLRNERQTQGEKK